MKYIVFLIKVVILLLLPFLILIRGSVYLHMKYAFHPTFSLLGGVVLTAILLFLYFSIVYLKINNKVGNNSRIKSRAILAFLLVAVFTIHGMSFFNTENLKNKALASEISELHPILRLASSTLTFLDKKLVVTDASRIPEDYTKMGLKTPRTSLHYPQKDGYAYAVDIRTNGRSELINKVSEFYFQLMGFRTLRHKGTEDHLHISLYCHHQKKAI